MQIKVDVHIAGVGPVPATTLVQCVVGVDFDGSPVETMTITALVPNQGDEAAIQAAGVARAKVLARLLSKRGHEADALDSVKPMLESVVSAEALFDFKRKLLLQVSEALIERSHFLPFGRALGRFGGMLLRGFGGVSSAPRNAAFISIKSVI